MHALDWKIIMTITYIISKKWLTFNIQHYWASGLMITIDTTIYPLEKFVMHIHDTNL